jgi:LCP family protein required for cell wall assembly
VRRSAALAILAIAAWVAGSAIGAVGPPPHAGAQTGIVLGKAHAGFAPSVEGSRPVVILLIGSGARPGEELTRSLADSIHVVSINAAKRKATVIGIPRDSWVNIPGRGMGKINSSMFYGGPELLIGAIEDLSGLSIDYYALTTFWGVTDLYDQIGGLTIDVPFSMSDPYSRSEFAPGVQKLSGREVLSFSRDRHSFTQGDFARTENGGRLLLASLAQFRKQFQKDPSAMFTWVGAGMRNVTTDLSLAEIIDLAFTITHVNPRGVQNIVLPGGTGTEGGLSVVLLSSSQTSAIFRDVEPDGIVSKKALPPSPTVNES